MLSFGVKSWLGPVSSENGATDTGCNSLDQKPGPSKLLIWLEKVFKDDCEFGSSSSSVSDEKESKESSMFMSEPAELLYKSSSDESLSLTPSREDMLIFRAVYIVAICDVDFYF